MAWGSGQMRQLAQLQLPKTKPPTKLANMPAHRPISNSANLQTSQSDAADMLNVGRRSDAEVRDYFIRRAGEARPLG